MIQFSEIKPEDAQSLYNFFFISAYFIYVQDIRNVNGFNYPLFVKLPILYYLYQILMHYPHSSIIHYLLIYRLIIVNISILSIL